MKINRNIRKVLSFVLMLFIVLGVANAQVELTLKEAIDFALQNKADAIKARLELKNAEYLIEDARSGALPKVNSAGTVTYNPKLQQMALDFNGQTQVLKMGTPWQSNAAIQLDQKIFDMAVFTGLKAARTTMDFYAINSNLTEEQIIEKVAESYFAVFKTKSQIETLDKTIQNSTRVRNVIQSLEVEGLAKKIDVDRISVALNNLNSTKIQLKNAVELQENALKYLIGMDITREVILPRGEFEVQVPVLSNDHFDISQRTEIQLLEKQGELLKMNKEVISASRYPSLGLSANYGYLSMGNRFPYFAGPEKGVNGSGFAGISLNLTVPIFNGYAIRSKLSQADIEIMKYEADFADTKLALSLDAENAYTQIQNALITLESQQSNMELAERVLHNVENNYQNGLATLTDLLDAETSYADAQNNYTTAIMDYKLAEIQLKRARGELKSYYLN